MKTFKKILGYSILASFFIGIYLLSALMYGFIPASIIFGATIIISLIIIGAVYLIVS